MEDHIGWKYDSFIQNLPIQVLILTLFFSGDDKKLIQAVREEGNE